MNIETISSWYAVMLLVKALLLTLMTTRCAWAIYKNHLEHKTRIVIWGTGTLALTVGIESWIRAWGRVQQLVNGIMPTQSNPEIALAALVLSNIGLLVWIVAIEFTTHLGIVPSGQPHRREGDPR